MLGHRITCICCHNKCFDLSIPLCASPHPSNGKCNGRASRHREETCQLIGENGAVCTLGWFIPAA